jgi:hypothetical protein
MTALRTSSLVLQLLPDGALREFIAERREVNAQREFFLLWLLGNDLPGACYYLCPQCKREATLPEPKKKTRLFPQSHKQSNHCYQNTHGNDRCTDGVGVGHIFLRVSLPI